MTTATEIHRHGLLTSAELPTDAIRDAWGKTLDEYVSRLTFLIDETIREEKRIQASRDYSPDGKGNRKRGLGKKQQGGTTTVTTPVRKPIEEKREQIADRVAVRPITLADLSDDKTSHVAFDGTSRQSPALFNAALVAQYDAAFRAHEHRQQLAEMKPNHAAYVLEGAANDGDALVMYAAETLPRWTADSIGLNNDRMRDLRTRFLKTRDPKSFAALDELDVVLDFINTNENMARRAIELVTGVGGDSNHALSEDAARDSINRVTGSR